MILIWIKWFDSELVAVETCTTTSPSIPNNLIFSSANETDIINDKAINNTNVIVFINGLLDTALTRMPNQMRS